MKRFSFLFARTHQWRGRLGNPFFVSGFHRPSPWTHQSRIVQHSNRRYNASIDELRQEEEEEEKEAVENEEQQNKDNNNENDDENRPFPTKPSAKHGDLKEHYDDWAYKRNPIYGDQEGNATAHDIDPTRSTK